MDAIIRLRHIMSKWPTKGETLDEEEIKSRFGKDVTADFDFSNLANRPNGEFSIFSKVLIIGKRAKVLVYDTSDSNYPNLAILERSEDGIWQLATFLFMCASCFGTGILSQDEPCDTCGVTGWGLVDYVNGKTAI